MMLDFNDCMKLVLLKLISLCALSCFLNLGIFHFSGSSTGPESNPDFSDEEKEKENIVMQQEQQQQQQQTLALVIKKPKQFPSGKKSQTLLLRQISMVDLTGQGAKEDVLF